MTDLTTLLRDLSAKASKATPGPWPNHWDYKTLRSGIVKAYACGPEHVGEGRQVDGSSFWQPKDAVAEKMRADAAYLAACPPALIQALVAVALAAIPVKAGGWDLHDALRRLEAVAQHLQS